MGKTALSICNADHWAAMLPQVCAKGDSIKCTKIKLFQMSIVIKATIRQYKGSYKHMFPCMTHAIHALTIRIIGMVPIALPLITRCLLVRNYLFGLMWRDAFTTTKRSQTYQTLRSWPSPQRSNTPRLTSPIIFTAIPWGNSIRRELRIMQTRLFTSTWSIPRVVCRGFYGCGSCILLALLLLIQPPGVRFRFQAILLLLAGSIAQRLGIRLYSMPWLTHLPTHSLQWASKFRTHIAPITAHTFLTPKHAHLRQNIAPTIAAI
jgi:hypothetical protein